MVEQCRRARDRGCSSAPALRPREGSSPLRLRSVSPPTGEPASAHGLHLGAALPRARGRRRRALRARGAEGGGAAVANRALRRRPLPDRCGAQLAARDALGRLPARHAPAPERRDRGLGAAAPRPRPDAADAAGAGEAGWPHVRGGDAPARRAPGLARRLVRDPLRGLLRRRALEPLAPERRARAPDRDRARLLVAGDRRPRLAAGRDRLPRRGVHRLGLPRARADVLDLGALRLLRDRASDLGSLGASRIRTTAASS